MKTYLSSSLNSIELQVWIVSLENLFSFVDPVALLLLIQVASIVVVRHIIKVAVLVEPASELAETNFGVETDHQNGHEDQHDQPACHDIA